METEFAKAFDPSLVETRWYNFWLENKIFAASDAFKDSRPVYVLPMPPPNVTGSLHMGHALMVTLEDILIRYYRMCGFNALWQPGTDHAGIATQTVVERLLRREGKSRHDLGREKFIERVWEWKHQSGGRIVEQQRVLGASADWDRSKFTMEPSMSLAVREAFVRLYREGLIYRDTRLIYWDCEAQTVLSNLEVENEPANGELFEFAYPLAEGEGEIVVSTTRPETMLGDTAIAVHPEDERYCHLHGKFVQHPFVERKIPIITDAVLVDPKFGTGAVKVTPAHDFNDFATGKRHHLECITVLNLDGTMNANAGMFSGMDRFVARKAVKKALEERGLARGVKAHQLVLPRSERSGTVVEPMISTQWFVRMAPLAEPALAAVREGKTRIIPEEWTKTYEHWMTNILDWCISRQLWWGHRVPVFYCNDCQHLTVTTEENVSLCESCKSPKIHQDPDVLDTWFSSALWPFATLGWPLQTDALKKFYPASDLETGYDILFFWVARMMMMGIHFMGEPPFKRVLLHGLVVDETGDKMSKVKGNVIDPLDLIGGATFDTVVDKALPGAPKDEALRKFKKAYPSAAQMGEGFAAYGADALRFTLATYSPQAKRIPLSLKKIEGYRNFCNKIWNATRFAVPYLEGVVGVAHVRPEQFVNRWIVSRLSATIELVRKGIDEFRLDDASLSAYHFFWGELCDWYLEMTKPVFAQHSDDPVVKETKEVLSYVLETSLRMLHPFVPFITEELWHRIPCAKDRPLSIALAEYPSVVTHHRDIEVEKAMDMLQSVIVAARSTRSEHEIHPGAQVPLMLRVENEAHAVLLRAESEKIRTLVKTEGEPVIESKGAQRPKGFVMSVASGVQVLVGLTGLVDASKERLRIEREIKKTEKDIGVLEKKLSTASFVDKAPAEVVAESRDLLEQLRQKRVALGEAIAFADELS